MKILYIIVILFLLAFVSTIFCFIESISLFLYPENPDRNAEVVKLTLSVIGGIGVLLGLYIAHKRAVITEKTVENQSKQLEHAQKSQIDERFKNAVEHLGSDKEAIILGGVVELHQIAQENIKTYAEVVFNILTSYIRSQTDCTNVEQKDIKKAVIQTICDYLFKNKELTHYPYNSFIANLENVNLHSINLDNTDLSNCNFYNSFLPSSINTNYEMANLTACDFFDGTLENCNFINAHLYETKFLFLNMLNSDFGGKNNFGASFLYSKIKGFNIHGEFDKSLFYKSIIVDFNIKAPTFSFNKFLFCNLLNVDFSKVAKIEFCNFSKSGFLKCVMPQYLYDVNFSSSYELKESIYSLFQCEEIKMDDLTSFVLPKNNITDIGGISFQKTSNEFRCKKTDLTQEEVKKYQEDYNKLIKIHDWKKYAKDVNALIDTHLKTKHS